MLNPISHATSPPLSNCKNILTDLQRDVSTRESPLRKGCKHEDVFVALVRKVDEKQEAKPSPPRQLPAEWCASALYPGEMGFSRGSCHNFRGWQGSGIGILIGSGSRGKLPHVICAFVLGLSSKARQPGRKNKQKKTIRGYFSHEVWLPVSD